MNDKQNKFEQWAIVELFGHSRIAGLLTEQTIGGSSFVRIDVPEYVSEGQTFPAVTRLLGNASIYGITFVDEATATIASREIRYQPVSVWSLRRGLEGLPADARRDLLSDPEELNF